MGLQLYDTATRAIRPFVSLRDGQVGMYECGATVQGAPHIGHLRTAVVYDVLRRWLEYRGYDVTHVRNVTDIDDKILAKAAEARRPWWAHAAVFEREFADGYRQLGCLPATISPRATGHIPQILTLIGELVARGKAYAADGDVYFSVRNQADYGHLSGQQLEKMQQGESEGTGKRDPVDFTLWKGAKPGEPCWESPWGPGRPGWHIECSAMARTYLGESFDIHGGAIDLIFPHHENEAAQSHGAGLGFAQYWVHGYWLTLGTEKMSKSLGNVLSLSTVTKHTRPAQLRYYLVSVHYRSMIEYSREALDDAAKAYRRIEAFLHRVGQVVIGQVPAGVADAMDDDLAVPKALAVVHDLVRAGNAAADAGDTEQAQAAAAGVRAALAVLGCDPLDEHWAQKPDGDDGLRQAVDQLVAGLLADRAQARADKDFAAADAIRDTLSRAGIVITDTPDGPVWSLAESKG